MHDEARDARLGWVDVGKGICILLVVLMHSALGVEKAVGAPTWLHPFIEWARPFRMPDFFLISGLFLAARIDRPWRSYLDTKVVHFAYFYVLWLTIQFAVKAPAMAADQSAAEIVAHYLWSFVEPFGTLWFIYLLAVFFVAAKLLRGVSRTYVLIGAAALHVLVPETGWLVIDEFANRFLFFFAGYALARHVFAFGEILAALPRRPVVVALAAWIVLNAFAVATGLAFVPVIDIAVSSVGIAAVIAVSVLLAESGTLTGRALAYMGRHSIAIYLAFTLFMGPARVAALKLLGPAAAGLAAILATAAGVIGPLLLRGLVAGTPAGFLFERPAAFRLGTAGRTYEGPAATRAG